MPRKAVAGAPMDPLASDWNRMVDTAEHFERNQRLGKGLPPKQNLISTDIVKIKNDTGDDLVRGSVVQLSSNLLTGLDDYDPEHLWFSGVEVATPPANWFGVVRRAVPEDEIEECQLSGLCIARVNVLNYSHGYAIPKSGQSYFESAMIGPVKIFDKPTGTGVAECVVILNTPIIPLLGITVDTITRSSDATIKLIKRTATGYTTWLDIDDAPMTIEARCGFLNTADEIPPNYVVSVGLVEGWFPEVLNAWCAERDFDLEDE